MSRRRPDRARREVQIPAAACVHFYPVRAQWTSKRPVGHAGTGGLLEQKGWRDAFPW